MKILAKFVAWYPADTASTEKYLSHSSNFFISTSYRGISVDLGCFYEQFSVILAFLAKLGTFLVL